MARALGHLAQCADTRGNPRMVWRTGIDITLGQACTQRVHDIVLGSGLRRADRRPDNLGTAVVEVDVGEWGKT